jgi:hypothetical protein
MAAVASAASTVAGRQVSAVDRRGDASSMRDLHNARDRGINPR